MGAVAKACEDSGRVLRRRGPRERAASSGSRRTAAGHAAWCSSPARSCGAGVVITAIHPQDHVPRAARAHGAAGRVRPRHRALEDAQRHGEGQPGDRPAARVHGRTRSSTRRSTAARSSCSTTSSSSRQAFQDARFGQAARVPFSDTEIPTVFDTTLAPEGNAHRVDVHAVGAGGLGRRRGRPRPSSRPTPTALIERFDAGRARVQGLGAAPPDHRAQARWSRSTDLIGGNIFHGELTVDQLFHMRPAVGLRRLPNADHGPVPGVVGDACRRRCHGLARPPRGARDPEGQGDQEVM